LNRGGKRTEGDFNRTGNERGKKETKKASTKCTRKKKEDPSYGVNS